MKLYIREKVFSWSDKFTVKDSYGNDRYMVEGEVFSWGKKLHVYDMMGQEVAFIAQRLFTWMPRYTVSVNGQEVAEVRQRFSFLFQRYSVDGPGWDISGSFLEHNYQITRGFTPVVTVEKEWMTWGDSYVLDIADPADEILALAVVVVLDCMAEDQSDNN